MQQQNVGDLPATQPIDRTDRQMTVLINAAIAQGGRDGLCRIRNISPGGLNVETSLTLLVDTPAIVTLHSGRTLHCIVRWARDNRVGMTCSDDPTELLQDEKALGPVDHAGPSLPRFQRSASVQITVHGLAQRCQLDSLSARDVLLTGVPLGLETGQYIGVHLQGLGDFPATVRISDGDALFASFATPIAFGDLDAWLPVVPMVTAPFAAAGR